MTIGIEPTFPSTGFGYIESGAGFARAEGVEFRKAVRFVEKPDAIKGDPELPLTDEELNDKFTELAEPVLGKAAAAALLKQLWNTDKLANVDYDTGAGAKRAPKEVLLQGAAS